MPGSCSSGVTEGHVQFGEEVSRKPSRLGRLSYFGTTIATAVVRRKRSIATPPDLDAS
jgi:hypothetical protein